MLRRLFLSCAFFLLASSAVHPQGNSSTNAKRADANTLVSIHVVGAQRFSEQDILRSFALRLGQEVGEEDLKEASDKLGATGVFTRVLYSYSFSPEGTKLELQLQENDKLLPARFDNIVWFSDNQLMQQVHQRVPLFDGVVPVAGSILDTISKTIQDLLLTKGVPAHVNYLKTAHANQMDAIVFSVEGVPIHIRKFEVGGVSEVLAPVLQTFCKKLEGADYYRSRLSSLADLSLIPEFHSRGFLKAFIGQPKITIAADAPGNTLVDVVLPIVEGAQYRLASLQWMGNKSFSAAELNSQMHMPLAQPADGEELRKDLQNLGRTYGAKGYLGVKFDAEPTFDDTNQTVAYTIKVDEGDIYHMGQLHISGLDPETASRLQQEWKLRPGDPFDITYPRKFMTQNFTLLPRGVSWRVSEHQDIDSQAKAVSVTLRYGHSPDGKP